MAGEDQVGHGLEKCHRRLTVNASADLAWFAQSLEVPVGLLVQLAWAGTLAWHGQQSDSLFGLSHSNRDVDENNFEYNVGPFTNTSVCRWSFISEQPLQQAIKTYHHSEQKRRQHQWLSLLDIKQVIGRGPNELLCSSYLVLDNTPTPELYERIEDGQINQLELSTVTEMPLRIEVVTTGQIQITMRYQHWAFEPQTIETLLSAFVSLLQSFDGDPDDTVAQWLCATEDV
jgi:hypothetical protein